MSTLDRSSETEVISGISVIGYSMTNKGVGHIARTYAKVFQHLGLKVSARAIHNDVSANMDYLGLPNNPVNLIIANPNQSDIKQAMDVVGLETFKSAYNIGSWWWELASAPPSAWKKLAFLYKEVWAGSRFIQKLLSENFSLPIKYVPPVVELTPQTAVLPEHFEIADDEFIFLFVCDFDSVPHRKNPKALIEAFRMAFSPSEKTRLFIKASNTKSGAKYWNEMIELAKGANITLLDKALTRAELDSLFYRANCYASLHRSEGFGLTIAEAMLAGKPVIATGWSGNMDFTTAENSFLVPYTLVNVPEGARPYRMGSQWAEPNIEAASTFMRDIFANPQKAATKARLGAKTIQSLYSKAAVAAIVDESLNDARVWVKQKALEQNQKSRRTEHVLPHISLSETTKVSVCLPVCNGEEFLPEAIESILNQTFSNFELIIIDDASDDSSYAIANEFAQRDSRIRLSRNEKRKGLFPNYNECMRQAVGKYIKPFAQDDVLNPSMLTVAVSVMERHPSISVFTSRRRFIDYKGERAGDVQFANQFLPKVSEDTVVTGDSAIAQCLFPIVNRIGEPCVVLLPRRLVSSGFDERFHHMGDLDFWFELLQKGTAYQSSENLCSYRVHGDRATESNMQSLVWALDTLRMGRKLESFFSRNDYSFDDYIARETQHLLHWGKRMTEADLYFGQLALEKTSVPVDSNDFKDLLLYILKHADGKPVGTNGERSLKERRLSNHVRELEQKIAELQNEANHHEGIKIGYLTDVSERIEALENEVKELMGSQSWKFTESLRQMSRVFSRSSQDNNYGHDSNKPIFEDLRSEDEIMHDYLLHLANLKTSIQKSRSWQLTAPLRSLGLFRD